MSIGVVASDRNNKLERVIKINMGFKSNILNSEIDPLNILSQVAELGDIVDANTNVSKLPNILDIDPKSFYLSWVVVLRTRATLDEVEKVLRPVKVDNIITIEELDESYLLYINEIMMENKIGEVLLEKGLITEEELRKALGSQRRLGEILIDEGKVLPSKLESIIEQQSQVRKYREMNSVKIETIKLDEVLKLLEQLAIHQKEFNVMAKTEEPDKNKLDVESSRIDGLINELQVRVSNIRNGQ